MLRLALSLALSLTLSTACTTPPTRPPADAASVTLIRLPLTEANEVCKGWLGEGSYRGCYRGNDAGTAFTVIWTNACSLHHELYHVATGPGHEQFPPSLRTCEGD